MKILRKFIALALVLGVGAIGAVLLYFTLVLQRLDERFSQLKSTQPTQFLGSFPPLKKGQTFFKGQLKTFLEDQGFVERPIGADLLANEFSWTRGSGTTRQLLLSRSAAQFPGLTLDRLDATVTVEEVGNEWKVTEIKNTDTGEALEQIESLPKKLGAFYAGRLRTQSPLALSDMPVPVRYAVMAIEDAKFLEHSGVSVRSTLRALWRDARAGKWVEGGSTITQQLMKNLFFSREKALRRKLKEALYALIAEARYSKEDILEAYLNEVYMGQWSTHEIHGVAEGARYYFNRDLSQISVAQAATLAAIIQAPNAHDPRKHADRLLKRRNLVLRRMLEAEFILEEEFENASREALAVVPQERALDDVNYFLDLLLARLPSDIRQRLEVEPLTLYTTLNPYLQSAAAAALQRNLARIQQMSPAIKKLEKKGIHVQSALIAIDLETCGVLALQGGKSYRQTQFNRVLQGMRQPGSLFKPFVYLAAFDPELLTPPITPITEIEDQPFEWKYEGQTWSPRNYDGLFRGNVLAKHALQDSLNVPTAKIAERVGIENVVKILKAAGITSPLPSVPSLSLGSAEVTPIELAEAYSTLATLGHTCPATPYQQVFDASGNLILENKALRGEILSPPAAFQTVNVLKGVFARGTAKSAAFSGLNLALFAGKTGTTNDYKDAWFVGFSPKMLALVWVGYDEEAKIGLTGASAALPLWLDYVRQAHPFLGTEDFVAPEGIAPHNIDMQTKRTATTRCPVTETEFFLRGTEPDPCLQHQ